MLGLLRLLTNQKVMAGDTFNIAGALAIYDRWRLDPRVEFASEPRQTDAAFRRALAWPGLQPRRRSPART